MKDTKEKTLSKKTKEELVTELFDGIVSSVVDIENVSDGLTMLRHYFDKLYRSYKGNMTVRQSEILNDIDEELYELEDIVENCYLWKLKPDEPSNK